MNAVFNIVSDQSMYPLPHLTVRSIQFLFLFSSASNYAYGIGIVGFNVPIDTL